jgi:predicted dehydrogenase
LEQTRALADRLGVPEVHTDYRELCARPDIDAVTIVTPPWAHAEPAITALRQGKHAFCEKPLAMKVVEAKAMVAAAEVSGKIHQVGFTFRYGYAVRELKRRVQAGDIGEPYYVRTQYDGWEALQDDSKADGPDKKSGMASGVLFHLGSHLFDIVRFVFGPLRTVTGFLYQLPRRASDRRSRRSTGVDTDDIAAAWFRHENGLRGQWFIGRITPPLREKGYLEVIGPLGALRAGLSRGTVDCLKVSRPTAPEWEDLPLPRAARDRQPHSVTLMMRSFVDACLRGSLDARLDASFHDGLEVQQAMQALLEANLKVSWVKLARSKPAYPSRRGTVQIQPVA